MRLPVQAVGVFKMRIGKSKLRGPAVHQVHKLGLAPRRVLREGEGYKIKRIAVKPGARLSLQRHRFRSEHWVVLSGVAKVTNGDDVLTIRPNESTYIPAGRMHRLENPGTERLEIVEVQVGSYVGEDDIERFDDDYRRG